ncbi:chromatin target of PRMT1 protein isoform X2 [Salmo salar]|uniref:Chromatin target of PRMT1 protein isoform X2 n=1 Tax=Salmo salar TaxID=8030 RepID=A0A1S3MME7_SALSA|nr:chromatin target of PRMT1 protein isoform X2 [Salmo salar]|eukprot:XP_014004265.1 PREDICTED: chromatin target of PRMT1 protein-like isoform X2 [Salmo salar]
MGASSVRTVKRGRLTTFLLASSSAVLKRMYQQTDAMTSPTEKIVLKSTSTVSLNDRFTTLLNNKQLEPVAVRVNMQQQQVASVRNRRLALQMENRTSVQAALQPKSLKLCLGKGDVLARLGRPMGTLMRGATRSQGFAVRGLRGMNRGGFRVCGNRRGFFRGVNQMRARGGVTKLRFRPGLRLQGGQLNNAGVLVSCGARNGLGLRGRGRGAGLGLRGRGGFRGRGMGKPEKIPTKEELDNQLDNYMSMTKSRLDAELDSYMAMAGSDYME